MYQVMTILPHLVPTTIMCWNLPWRWTLRTFATWRRIPIFWWYSNIIATSIMRYRATITLSAQRTRCPTTILGGFILSFRQIWCQHLFTAKGIVRIELTMTRKKSHLLFVLDLELEPIALDLGLSLLLSVCLRFIGWEFSIVASSCDIYCSVISRHTSLRADFVSGNSSCAADSNFSVDFIETLMWSIINSVFSSFASCCQLLNEENSFHRLLSSFIHRMSVIQLKSFSGCLSKKLTESARILKTQNTWCAAYCKGSFKLKALLFVQHSTYFILL